MRNIKLVFFLLLMLVLVACQSPNKDLPTNDQADSNEVVNEDKGKDIKTPTKSSTTSFSEKVEEDEDQPFLEDIEHAKSLDYEKVASEALKEATKLAPNDRELRKWIIRLYIYQTMQNKEVSETLLEDAKEAKQRREDWFKYVETEYAITTSASEVDEYIKENTKNDDNTKAIAKGLGMSLEYLNYTYERDQYTQQVIWGKLLPILLEKYPNDDKDGDSVYMEKVNKKFNEELDEFQGI